MYYTTIEERLQVIIELYTIKETDRDKLTKQLAHISEIKNIARINYRNRRKQSKAKQRRIRV